MVGVISYVFHLQLAAHVAAVVLEDVRHGSLDVTLVTSVLMVDFLVRLVAGLSGTQHIDAKIKFLGVDVEDGDFTKMEHVHTVEIA